ncbi:hypothetical protein TYRP_009247 [Tyrophagus putrescentiae]|nr:hypothetical protein TYRP_009247 [Tyrophagus putrescentiae]
MMMMILSDVYSPMSLSPRPKTLNWQVKLGRNALVRSLFIGGHECSLQKQTDFSLKKLNEASGAALLRRPPLRAKPLPLLIISTLHTARAAAAASAPEGKK